MFDEIEINLKEVRSYREYPRVIEDRGCPRCESVLLLAKLVNFSNDKLAFGVTCENCGLYFIATEVSVPGNDSIKKIQLAYEE